MADNCPRPSSSGEGVGWPLVQLGDTLAAVLGGGTPSRGVREYWGGSVPWASVKDMNRRLLTSTQEYITPAGVQHSATRVVPAGTVLVATRMAVGAVAVAGVEIAFNQDIKALIPDNRLRPAFLVHLLGQRAGELVAAASGTTVKGLGVDDLRRLSIPLPSLAAQDRIVSILDAIDTAIERTDAVIEAAEALRRALLQDLLTRGVRGWHSAWRTVPGVGELPACWEVVRLGDVLRRTQYGTNAPLSDSPTGVRVLRMGNLARGEIVWESVKWADLPYSERDSLILKSGDLLFNRTNSIDLVGKISLVGDLPGPTSFASYLVRLEADDQVVDPYWLNSLLNWTPMQARIRTLATKGASQANINPTSLRSIPVPLPPLREQCRVRDVIQSVDAHRRANVDERVLLSEIKREVSNSLLSGRVRVQT